MELTFLQTMILYCLQKINGERTIYSIYHLLKGKKSSQTIQDTHLFHLNRFFQTETNMSRNEFRKDHCQIFIRSLLINISDNVIGLQNMEKTFWKVFSPSTYSCFFKWLEIPERTANVFWERLSLSVQVISTSSE